jgi:hypothetical protein
MLHLRFDERMQLMTTTLLTKHLCAITETEMRRTKS